MSQTFFPGTYTTTGVTLSGNPATIATSGYISGTVSGTTGVYGAAGTAWTLTNEGVVSETGVDSLLGFPNSFGISFAASGTIINTGSGTIAASAIGIVLIDGGSVTNQAGGTISSGVTAIYGKNGFVTVVNASSIVGASGTGVDLLDGGSVTNQSGGTISGYDGIYDNNAALTVVNAGSIGGYDEFGIGVFLYDGGSVTNQSGGTISAYKAIYSYRSAATVINAGTISGSHYAVKFAAGFANRLVIDPNAVFYGQVTGGNAIGAAQVSTLELGSGASAGTLSGLGTTIVDFAQITVDAGAQWTLTSANTIAAGYTLTDAGTLTNANTLGTTLTLAPGGVISNSSTGTITAPSGAAVYGATGGTATVVNAGLIAGSYGDGRGIDLAGGGSVTNQSGGAISGYYGIEGGGAPVTVVNTGSIAGSGQGVFLSAGGDVTNQSGGAISSVGVGILAENSAATVVNYGSIGYAGGMSGVALGAGGTVTNQSGGVISAYSGISGQATLTVVNAGIIAGSEFDGVLLDAGGSVTNQSGGTISGYSGIVAVTNPATVVNAGYIAATGSAPNAYGVYLGAGGTVTNLATGTISGGGGGIKTEDGPAAVVNYGLVAGEQTGIFMVDGGSITNQAGGTISSGEGIFALLATTVDNAGSIIALGDGVELATGGSVTNQSGGTITGNGDGVGISAAYGAVDNLGYIDSSQEVGVYLADGGVVINGAAGGTVSSAYIGGYSGGVKFGPANAGTLINYGTVSGLPASPAVHMYTGTVVNGPSGTTGALIEAGGGDGVYIDGAGTVINNGQIVSNGQGKYYGVRLVGAGIIGNLGTASLIEGSIGVYAQLNDTVTNAGTIASNANYGTAGIALAFGGGTNRLIVDPGATFIGTVSGGGPVTMAGDFSVYTIGTANAAGTTTLELASGASAGTLSGFGTAIVNFSSLVFDSGSAWTVSGNDAASGLGTLGISGFTYGDTIDLTGFVAVSETVTGDTLVLTNEGGSQDTLTIQGSFATGGFGLAVDGTGTGTDITVICFAAGTLIDTPAGEVQVEKLQVGDLVMTLHNGPRPVKWIGNGKVLSTPNRRTAATPVIVRKGALGPNMPHQDLRVTKAHSLYVDKVLIPVEFLVNYKTIIWDDRAQEVEIYHVELESHDVLIANGAPAESFRNDGNRWLFQNAYSGWDLPAQEPYAPVLTGGPVVDAVWERLLDRAGRYDLPALTEEADLHLIVDGVRVDATGQTNGGHLFRLPCQPNSVVIGSRAGVPAELGVVRDPRCLGAALRRVTIRQGAKFMLIDADDERLTAGFHDYEPAETIRWTDGHGELPIQAFARFDAGAEVTVHLGGSTRYAVADHRNVSVAA